MPRAGESLGKYKLVRRIGLGGMAEVWLAKVTGPGGFAKKLVVKTVLEHQAQNAEFIAQFLDEARLAALLTHPNIVQIFELGDHKGIYFIAMEYVKGRDLQDVRKQCADRDRPLPMPYLARMACGVCEGLHYAHELADEDGRHLALVHRDVSPENVLISYDGAVKIVDFGIAKASISQVTTRAGLFKGKLHYATPERLLGQPIDRRDDIYGLGAVLYETATGRPPITGRSEGEMVKKILDGDFPRPRELAPEIPEEFETIILKCMAWGPEERYATARDLQKDLERYVASSGEPATTFDVAEFMKDLFADEAGTTSDRFGVGDFDDLTPTTDPFETLGEGGRDAFLRSHGVDVATASRDSLPSGSHEIGPDGVDLVLDGTSIEEEALEAPTVETAVREEPRPLVPPKAAAVGPSPPAQPAPAYYDDEPPVVPRNRLGLVAGGAVALLLAGGVVAFAIWSPWNAAGGTPTGPGAPPDPGPATGDGAVAHRGDASVEVPDPAGDAEPGRGDAAPLFPRHVEDAAPAAEAGVLSEDADPAEPEDAGGVISFEDARPPRPPVEPEGPTGTLALRGPPGCSAHLGDARLGGLPLDREVPVGTHELRLRCPHGIRRSLTVTIREGATTTETIRVRTGSLLLLVRPWAEVYVDGRRRGITPLGAIELPEGNHTVRLVNSEIGARETRRVRIRPGERTTLRVRLDR